MRIYIVIMEIIWLKSAECAEKYSSDQPESSWVVRLLSVAVTYFQLESVC